MEDMANGLVRRNLPVTATIYDSEEDLAGVPLRKHAEGLIAPIRVVSIEDADSCTCCAPHVHSTGEIGAIKIVSAVAYKGGMRMTFLCGGRALKQFQKLQGTVDAIARKFSTAGDEVLSAVEKQEAELKAIKKEKADLTGRLEEYLTAELKAQAEDVKGKKLLVRLTDTDPKRLRPLALATLPEKGLTLLLTDKNGQLSYVLCANGLKLDMGELIPAVNLALGGRGGGRGTLAQGSAPTPTGLPETVEQLKTYLKQRLAN
jgi:alanyl-tRNA synthetase